jgi:hypothetical protein
MKNILSGFLMAGLLPIGEDDEKLNLLEAAAADLAKQISESPLLAYRFALAGMDDRVTTSDPAIKEAEKAVISKWQTITNKIGPSPVQVYRATILQALEIASSEKKALYQAVGLIVENEPELHSKGKEREVIDAMLQEFNENAMKELSEVWINPVYLGLSKVTGKTKKVQINKDELAAAIARAVGPQDKAGQALTNANPNWPDVGQLWANEFVGRATDAIYATVQSAAKSLADETQEAVRGLLSGIGSLAIRDAKSELLWMRTSMYSPSARGSYRTMKPVDLIIHAALDMSRAVGPSAPPSVEFFLRDLVAAVTKKTLKLAETLTAVGQKFTEFPEGEMIKNDTLPLSGRRTWLAIAVQPIETAGFEEQTGVPRDHEELAAELAVKFYRELQVRKLLSAAK